MDTYSTYVDKSPIKYRTNYVTIFYHQLSVKQLFFQFFFLFTAINTYATTDTTHVYFRLDKPQLDKPATSKIDSLLYADIINAKDEYLLVGYADHLGTNLHNDTLSLNRARNVKAYLVNMGIPGAHISMCIGKGEIPRDVELPEGYASDRRVDIVKITKTTSQAIKTAKTTTVIKKDSLIESTPSDKAVSFNTITPIKKEQLKAGTLFILDRIYFYTGRHKIVEESQPELEKLYYVLADNPTLVIRIEGHVCCVPPITDALDDDTHEVALSRNRARFIYDYLVKKGIDADRLSYMGFGKTRPLRKNEFSQIDQDMNKRVEIRILKN